MSLLPIRLLNMMLLTKKLAASRMRSLLNDIRVSFGMFYLVKLLCFVL
jgi:hypothetical protein